MSSKLLLHYQHPAFFDSSFLIFLLLFVQEDAHMVVLDLHRDDEDPAAHPTTGLFGIFDGHGGKEVAAFSAAHLPGVLASTEGYRNGDMESALKQAFLRMDEIMVMDENRRELKALMAVSDDDEGGGRGTGRGAMTINSSQLPNAVLDALGMAEEDGGFIVKIVKAANGQMQIDEISAEGQDDETDGDDGTGVEVQEDVGEVSGISARTVGDDEGSGKRQRRDMQIDGPFSNVPRGKGEEEGGGGEGVDAGTATIEAEAPLLPPGVFIEELSSLGEGGEEEEWRGPGAGCTAVCAMVRCGELIVANAGDSRCVLSRAGQAIALTQDHKPMDPEEFARITKAGGFVADGRVNGSLNLSRALGDLEYKQSKELPPEEQMVTAAPEIRREKLQSSDEFIILACDGIWDVLTNQEAVEFVRERLLAGKTPKQVCEEACDHCLAEDTGGCGKGCDNMSIVVAVLRDSTLAEKAIAARTAAGHAFP